MVVTRGSGDTVYVKLGVNLVKIQEEVTGQEVNAVGSRGRQ